MSWDQHPAAEIPSSFTCPQLMQEAQKTIRKFGAHFAESKFNGVHYVDSVESLLQTLVSGRRERRHQQCSFQSDIHGSRNHHLNHTTIKAVRTGRRVKTIFTFSTDLIFILGLCLLSRICVAQTNCTDCPSVCAGFVSTPCSYPNGCTGMTVCNQTTGFSDCYTPTAHVNCSSCGSGGFQQCSGAGSLSVCRAAVPSSEVCNSCDDDHDGKIDEGLTPAPCTQSDGCSGNTVCNNGVTSCQTSSSESTRPCSACGTGGVQRCLGGGSYSVCQPPVAQVESCNLCDDNRNGVVDDVLSEACTQTNGCSGVSICSGGLKSCEFSSSVSSTRPCVECGNGGYQACSGTGTTLVAVSKCRPSTLRTETCDACDDDGDGSLDTANGTLLKKSCQGGGCSAASCQLGMWSACSSPKQEKCNGLDDTCDDLIDEGNACRASTACVCIPRVCNATSCDSQPDGCGGTLTCATCNSPMTCGGGGTPNVCGCPAKEICPSVTCTAPEISCADFGFPELCVANLCQCNDSC